MPTDLNALPLTELYAELAQGPSGRVDDGPIRRLLELVREEDLGPADSSWQTADVTSEAFVDNWLRGEAQLVAREPGIVAGLACIEDLLFTFKADVDCYPRTRDGERVGKGEVIATLKGNLKAILTAERALLNLLSRLSGVATLTGAFVQAAGEGGRARVYDTRKTTPGLRVLEKYAVRCGGGHCHRLGLSDAVLIKDNHLATIRDRAERDGRATDDLAKLVRRAVKQARLEAPRQGLRFVMMEVDRLEQLQVVLAGNAAGQGEDQVGIILLDNMTPDQLRACVQLRDELKVPVELEASGGVELSTIASVSATGVDRISVGALTRDATWLDLALDI
jgi:nicotinate-nucleotide pyrophosphorylase (carboxylating)